MARRPRRGACQREGAGARSRSHTPAPRSTPELNAGSPHATRRPGAVGGCRRRWRVQPACRHWGVRRRARPENGPRSQAGRCCGRWRGRDAPRGLTEPQPPTAAPLRSRRPVGTRHRRPSRSGRRGRPGTCRSGSAGCRRRPCTRRRMPCSRSRPAWTACTRRAPAGPPPRRPPPAGARAG
eukprot:scaffold8084_cov90-Isochrysis_galbana.AAC.3